MPVFVTSVSTINRHGAYAIEKSLPATITAGGTGVAALVDQFPWGPMQQVITPSGLKDFFNVIAPPGFDRTGPGYLAAIRKGWPNNQLRAVRVLGATAATATVTLATAGAVNVLTVTAKYPGLSGNLLTATVSPSSDGVTGHFKLTVTVSGSSGTTSDIVDNLNYTGTGADSAPDLTKALLVGSITKLIAGTPAAGTFSLAGGTDGTINAQAYTGTQGASDQGIAKLEADSAVKHVATGDPGAALRPAVNAALQQHAQYLGDRVAYINGVAGQTAVAAQADVANYRSNRVIYCDPWCYINDDVTATKRLVPSAAFAMSVAAQLPPSTPIAWKSTEVQAMLSGVVDLEVDRGAAAGDNTNNGIVTMIREATGGFTFESAVLTIAPVDSTKARLTRTRMGDYIAGAFVSSTRGFVDSPNVLANQQSIIVALNSFMSGLKAAKNDDANHRVHVLDYAIGSIAAANSPDDLAAGYFYVPLDTQTSAGIEKMILAFRFGEGVKVSK